MHKWRLCVPGGSTESVTLDTQLGFLLECIDTYYCGSFDCVSWGEDKHIASLGGLGGVGQPCPGRPECSDGQRGVAQRRPLQRCGDL